jgi:hypothetical protein
MLLRTSGVGVAVQGLWFCALMGAATLLAGCSTSTTVVLVSVSGQVEGIAQLVVKLSAGGLDTIIYVPEMPAPLTLPTDFTIEMDRSRKGEVRIDINAKDSDAQVVASGSAIIADVVVGETNEISIELIATMPPDTGGADAGADSAPGAIDAEGIDGGAPDDAGAPDPDADLTGETAP